jgi:hypothetical protein
MPWVLLRRLVLFDEYSEPVTAAEVIIPPPRLKRKRASAAWLSPDGRLRRATWQDDGEPGWRFKIRKPVLPQTPAHGYWPDLGTGQIWRGRVWSRPRGRDFAVVSFFEGETDGFEGDTDGLERS